MLEKRGFKFTMPLEAIQEGEQLAVAFSAFMKRELYDYTPYLWEEWDFEDTYYRFA